MLANEIRDGMFCNLWLIYVVSKRRIKKKILTLNTLSIKKIHIHETTHLLIQCFFFKSQLLFTEYDP